jgi:hypothetical protein
MVGYVTLSCRVRNVITKSQRTGTTLFNFDLPVLPVPLSPALLRQASHVYSLKNQSARINEKAGTKRWIPNEREN